MLRPSDWPALQDWRQEPTPLVFEHGVWGKAHAASSDYRWLACSAGFDRDAGGGRLVTELNVGSEDLPQRMVLWRRLGDYGHAVVCYRSRAADSSGREGFVEKQVLQWRRPAGVPAAVGALLLLPIAWELTDAIWWQHRASLCDSDMVLRIDAADHGRVQCAEEGLTVAIEGGRHHLVGEAVGVPALEAFYADLLSNRRPARLGALRTPLPGAALAALLLPLPPQIADEASLAGWVPSKRVLLSELARWTGVVLPHSLTAPADSTAGAVPLEAWTMAQSLDKPDLVSSAFSDPTPAATTGAPSALSGHPAQPQAPPPVPAARRPPVRPHYQLALAPPRANSPLLAELHRFACDVEERWISTQTLRLRLPDGVRPLAGDEAAAAGELMARWIAALEQARPALADETQWGTKLDLLRSAALAFAPCAGTWRAVGPPRGERVPAFLLALALDPQKREGLAYLGGPALRAMLAQSLRCRPGPWTDRVRSWLDGWAGPPPRTGVRALIQAALQDQSAGSTTASGADW